MVESVSGGTSEKGTPFVAEEHIAFILEHPGMSDWLKNALREAVPRDPITVLNDLEILNLVLRTRAEALISGMFAEVRPSEPQCHASQRAEPMAEADL